MQNRSQDIDYKAKLGALLEENMTVMPLIARKIVMAAKVRARSTSSQIQGYILELLTVGPFRPTEISQVLGISKPNVTVLINSLIANGLARRSQDEKDRRNTYISITNKGKRLVQRKRMIIKNYIMTLFDKFDEHDIKSVCEGMEKYLEIMKKIDKAIGKVV